MTRRWRLRAAFALVLPVAAAAVGTARAIPHDLVVLQTLDKVTARVDTVTPESAAFIDIWERRPGEPVKVLFRGWMFASSPGLNALEHPVYDVWVLDCAVKPKPKARRKAPKTPKAQ